MGLFDKFLKKPAPQGFSYVPSSENEAWVGILLACLAADGDMDAFEIDVLARMLALKTKFSGIDIGPYLDRTFKAKNELGGLGLVEACAKYVSEDFKSTVFTMSVELVLADGTLDDAEVQIIEALAKEMNIEKSISEKIIEVMLIRNKGNLAL